MLHHTRRWNREPPRRAPERVAQRRRSPRVGERLRLVGRLERARQGGAAGDAPDPAAPRRAPRDRRLDTARSARRGRAAATSSRRAGQTARRRSGRSPIAGRSRSPESLDGADVAVEVPARGIAAVVDGVQVMAAPAGENDAFPVRVGQRVWRRRSWRAGTSRTGFVEAPRAAATTTVGLSPPRDRHVRRGAVRRGVEAAAAAAARLRRGDARHGRRAALRDRAARGDECRARRRRAARRPGDGRRPRRGARLRRVGRRAAADGGRVAARRRGGPARAPRAASSGTGRRASTRDGRTRFAILKGGSAWRAEGSDWYVDGGPQEPRYSLKLLLAGRRPRTARRRSASGSRSISSDSTRSRSQGSG